ncbi:MAG: DUF2914 domain-containing protein [Desulfobacterales bacterium]
MMNRPMDNEQDRGYGSGWCPLFGLGLILGLILFAFGQSVVAREELGGGPTLTQAVMCETIVNQRPVNEGLVFSVSVNKIHCLTSFENIAETQFITHHWYFRDTPVATFRLALQPPRWSTFSSLQIRGIDKGPWRVTVTDSQGKAITELRFSVSD